MGIYGLIVIGLLNNDTLIVSKGKKLFGAEGSWQRMVDK